MAEKARFYSITLQNGHEKWLEIHPAQSKNHLISALESQDVKVLKVDPLGWHSVSVQPDDDTSDVAFHVQIDGSDLNIGSGYAGHKYLKQQFHDKVEAVYKFMNDGR